MSKYNALWEYVQKNGSPSMKLSFAEIHDIAEIEIDHSFLKYKKELTQYGYQVEIYFKASYDEFRHRCTLFKKKVSMDTNIEMIPSYKVAYIRRTGSYGSENVQIMEQLKSWAREKNLLNESSIILGIAQDNPKFTESKDCRYDACLVISDEFKVDNKYINFGKTIQKEIMNLMIEDLLLNAMQCR